MGDGVEKPEPGRSAKVRENHGGAGLRWCRNTIMGQVQDGARKPLLISSLIVSKNHNGAGARWYKDRRWWVHDGAGTPQLGG